MHNPFRKDRRLLNRHSSQMAIRKPNASTVATEVEPELNHIRRSSYWIKRSIALLPSGVENLQPNVRKIQANNPATGKSIRMHTQQSEGNTFFMPNVGISNVAESDSRLTVLQKTQKQLIEQTGMLVDEDLPKLAACQHMFHKLNANIRMVHMHGSTGGQAARMLEAHLEAVTGLFNKVMRHTSDYVNSLQCASLIARNIDLEKQNSRLVDANMRLQGPKYQKKVLQYVDRRQVDLKNIDFDRILFMNYHSSQPKPLRTDLFSAELIKPYLELGCEQQSQFQLTNSTLSSVLASKQGHTIITKVINEDKKQRYFCNEGTQPSQFADACLSQLAVLAILKSNFNAELLRIVKKKIISMSRYGGLKHLNEGKVSLKELLGIMNRFSILRDQNKQKRIMVLLLRRAELPERVKLNENECQEVEKYLEQSCSQSLKDETKVLTQNREKLNRVSNKRLLNCVNISQTRRSQRLTRKKSTTSVQSQTTAFLEASLLNKTCFQVSQAILVIYFYIHEQMLVSNHIFLTLVSFVSHPKQLCLELDLILAKVYSTCVKSRERKSMLELSVKLAEMYDTSFKEQCKNAALREILQQISGQIVRFLASEPKALVITSESAENK